MLWMWKNKISIMQLFFFPNVTRDAMGNFWKNLRTDLLEDRMAILPIWSMLSRWSTNTRTGNLPSPSIQLELHLQPRKGATIDLKIRWTTIGRRMQHARNVERRDILGLTAQVYPKMPLTTQKAMASKGVTTRVEDNLLVLLKEQMEETTVAMASLEFDSATLQNLNWI